MIEALRFVHEHQYGKALVALLDVWRQSRDPRVADLVDLVSIHAAIRSAIPGKSVSDRDDAWRTIAKQKNEADVPRLLAALWPKQWRDARPLLDLLERFPDDPRIAAKLVATVADPPYTSSASDAFFKLVYFAIGKLADRRGLAALAKLGTPAKDAIAAMDKRPVRAIDEAALAQLAAHFAGDVARADDDATRGDALLAAVYESPDDDGPRAVYGDWLVERGDKRGELIALQLARGDGPATKREHELVSEHARTWAGELGKAFSAHVFERGFFAGGEYVATTAEPVRDPAARLVRTLTCRTPLVRELLAYLPSLRSLATTSVEAATLALPRLTTLAVSVRDRRDTEVLATCPGFPALRALAIYGAGDADWLVDAPVVDRIDRLAVSGPLSPVTANALRARVRVLEVHDESWKATYHAGSCRLTCPAKASSVTMWLERTLDRLPTEIAHLEIDPGAHVFDDRHRAILEPHLARFTGIEISVPWTTRATLAVEPTLELRISGRALLDRALLPTLWGMLAEAKQQYDALIVGSGKATKPLGDDPLAKLGTWAANAKTAEVTLRSTTRLDRALLSAYRPDARYSDPASNTTEIDLVMRGAIDALPLWFARLVKLTDANWALCDVKRERTFVHFDRSPVPIGWLSLVSAPIADRYPIDTIVGDGVTLLRHEGATILVTASTPAEATTERISFVAERLRAIGGT